MQKFEKTYLLTAENIDLISEEVFNIFGDLKMPKAQAIKSRFLIEEALIAWNKALGESCEISVKYDSFFFRPYLELSCSGGSFNPLNPEADDFFIASIKKTLTVTPDYCYRNGRNILRFKLSKPARNPLINLIIVIAAAIAVGTISLKLIPADVIILLQENFVAPTYNKFLDVLGCIAAPLIFCSVTWGIYGVGDTATLSKLGRGLILRYIRNVFFVTAGCSIFFPFFGCVLSGGEVHISEIFSVYALFLDMLPESIVDPFVTGNTLQIIVLASAVGIALIYLGKQTEFVAAAIEQLNIITSFLMSVISRLVPYFIAFVLINMIWSHSLDVLTRSWKFLLALIIALACIALVCLAATSLRFKVSVSCLIKKIAPAFLISVATASSSAAFGPMVELCNNKLGIRDSLTGFGVPLGIVMHKLASAANAVLLAFYIASINAISCSLSWIIMAVIVSTIIAIATPPVPGGAVIAYTLLFTQLGLPIEDMAIVLALDMLSDFLITGINIFCLPLALTDVAEHYNLLDKEVLRS